LRAPFLVPDLVPSALVLAALPDRRECLGKLEQKRRRGRGLRPCASSPVLSIALSNALLARCVISHGRPPVARYRRPASL
jgi:hypothetical protein